MKRFLNTSLIIFVVGFIGILNVEAAASFGKITGGNVKDKDFKVPITGGSGFVFTYDTTKISCGGENTSIYNKDGIDGRLISNDNVEISCTINFAEWANLILELKDPNQNKDSVGITYEINPSLKPTTSSSTSSTTTTTKPTTTTKKKSNNANLKSLEIKVAEKINTEEKKEEITTTTNNASTTKPVTTTTKKQEASTQIVELVNYSPNFKSDVYKYDAIVASNVKKVTINATMEDEKANMVISDNASKELKAGENNEITITVTAEDGSKKAYVINIKREALKSDATLKGIMIEEAPEFKFEQNKFSYRVKIKSNVEKLTISYELSDVNSKAVVMGNEDIEDGSKVKILVTAEDGTKKEYILNIEKEVVTTTKVTQNVEPEKNPLIIMGLSVIAFALIGAIIYVAKK